MYFTFFNGTSHLWDNAFFSLIVSDNNECFDDKGNCEHQCINTLGSYECKCNAGYSLSADGKTCQGKKYHT